MKRNNQNDTHRKCTVCKQDKPIAEFGKHACMSDGVRSDCKVCGVKAVVAFYKKHPEKRNAINKTYRTKHKAKVNAHSAKHRKKNPVYHKEYLRNWHLKTTYGITAEDYNNMFIEQGGRCAICGVHQSKLKKILHVDHCHETGVVRGLLCDGCNIAIGRMKDNVDILRNAIEYLGRSTDQDWMAEQ